MRTPQFNLYQFLLRSGDRDVEKLFKSFTFREVDELRDIVAEHDEAPENRAAEKVLTEINEMTEMMHVKGSWEYMVDDKHGVYGDMSEDEDEDVDKFHE
ncbi:hypothetical protein PRIC1_006854 [Phytophthora ramorum]